jgi:hypothetical protein
LPSGDPFPQFLFSDLEHDISISFPAAHANLRAGSESAAVQFMKPQNFFRYEHRSHAQRPTIMRVGATLVPVPIGERSP